MVLGSYWTSWSKLIFKTMVSYIDSFFFMHIYQLQATAVKLSLWLVVSKWIWFALGSTFKPQSLCTWLLLHSIICKTPFNLVQIGPFHIQFVNTFPFNVLYNFKTKVVFEFPPQVWGVLKISRSNPT